MLQKHGIIGVDSCVFIYMFEDHPEFQPLCAAVFDSLSKSEAHIIASAITVSEVMVKPFEKKNHRAIALYENVFATLPNFSLVPVDFQVAEDAARIRSEYGILLPDAIHIASSLAAGATLFATNDYKLARIRNMDIACLRDYA